MNNPVNFELAKLLKEKGYNFYHPTSYWEGEITHMTTGYALEDGTTSQKNYWDFERYYAPTISEVVMWLYEKHGIWIVVMPKRKDKGLFWGGYIDTGKDEFMKSYGSNFNTPTAAYKAAIEYALKNLIKK